MAQTFFFYDLETSGLSGREDRIMQFAGIRTDMELKQLGEPYNILIKLSDDTLPSPDALLVTGITPQMTQADGLSEAEFSRLLSEEIFTEDTIVVGFNNIRFDDEFIRHLLWRNFYDPYEWAWKDGRSRWDLLDAVRMTRALRPDGIEWPVDVEGKATNRLELLTASNGIKHTNAHDALSDVEGLIDLTRLLRSQQPQLFDYLLTMRDKTKVQQLVNLDDKQPFVYVSGRFEEQFHKGTVAFPLTAAPNRNVLVYDLRYDPTPFLELSEKVLAAKVFATWEERQAEGFEKLPVKVLQYNHCPAVAPLVVLDAHDGWQRLQLDKEVIKKHAATLLTHPDFAERLRSLYEGRPDFPASSDPEAKLYDAFVPDVDKLRIQAVRNASPDELVDLSPQFIDERLPELLIHYKARNFPKSLTQDEQVSWEAWRASHLQAQLPRFAKALERLAASTDESQKFILQEVQLWAESILPTPND